MDPANPAKEWCPFFHAHTYNIYQIQAFYFTTSSTHDGSCTYNMYKT